MVIILFRPFGVVSLSYLERGKSINNISCIEDSLKPLIESIESSRQTYGTKNLKFHHENARPHIHNTVLNRI